MRDAGYVLEKAGAELQLKEHDSLKINPDGGWYWHSRGFGNISPVWLVRELEDLNGKDAVHKLAEYAEGVRGEPIPMPKSRSKEM